MFIGSTDSHSADVGLVWYDGDSTITGPSSCTVGGTFTPPTPSTRPGYVFAGWKIQEIHLPPDPRCGIDQLDTSINCNNSNLVGYTKLDGTVGKNESKYGLTQGSGRWAVEYSYGTVWGMAKCISTIGSWRKMATQTSTTSGRYCWCQATGFTASGNSYTSGPQCTTATSSLWMYVEDESSTGYCRERCPRDCSNSIQYTAAARVTLFGAAGQ